MTNSFFDDFFEVLNHLSTYETSGGRFYDPNYGGWLSSDNKRQMYSNNFANFMNWYSNAQTNQTNLQLAREQNQWNIDQWNRENDYNSPAMQVQRLKEAGLSSAAAAQSVANIPAASLQSANLANQQQASPFSAASFGAGSPLMQMLQGLTEVIGMARGLQSLKKEDIAIKKESNELDFQVPFLASRNAREAWANKLQIQEFENTAKLFPYTRRFAKWQARNEKKRSEALDLANIAGDWQNKMLQQRFSFLETMNDKDIQEATQRIANLIQEEANLKEQNKKIKAETAESGSRAALNRATKTYVEEQTEGQRTQNKILGHEEVIQKCNAILAEAGFPDDMAGRVAAFMVSKNMSYEQCYDFVKGLRTYHRVGYEALFNNHDDEEFLQEYYENVFNSGRSVGLGRGVYQLGYPQPFLRRLKSFIGW